MEGFLTIVITALAAGAAGVWFGYGRGCLVGVESVLLGYESVIWKKRHEHSAYVFQDRIWVAGGHAEPLNSEVWSLEIPDAWLEDA